MGTYLIKRCLTAILLIFLVSLISFVVMEAPPGDFATHYVEQQLQMEVGNKSTKDALLKSIRSEYGLDKPLLTRYYKWISKIVTEGDFGLSFSFDKPVVALLKERLPITIYIGLGTMIFLYIVAVPIGKNH